MWSLCGPSFKIDPTQPYRSSFSSRCICKVAQDGLVTKIVLTCPFLVIEIKQKINNAKENKGKNYLQCQRTVPREGSLSVGRSRRLLIIFGASVPDDVEVWQDAQMILLPSRRIPYIKRIRWFEDRRGLSDDEIVDSLFGSGGHPRCHITHGPFQNWSIYCISSS